MGDATSISWTDATWNPIRGCRRTAPEGSKQSGCGDPTGGGCYAERQAARFCGKGQAYEGLITLTKNGPRWSGKARLVLEHLLDPIKWRRPRRIFTDSMSDLFYDGFDDYAIDSVVAVMMIACLSEDSSGHIFQTLTKRPDRMQRYFTDPTTQERVARRAASLMEESDGWFDLIAFRAEGLVHPNMWWGTSVENQAAADDRVPELLATPAAVRFLSCEPLLADVSLWAFIGGELRDASLRALGAEPLPGLDWVIVGCESGPGARACDVGWIRDLIDECRRGGVPVFVKQAFETVDMPEPRGIHFGDGSKRKGNGSLIELPYVDGVQYKEFPDG